MLYPVFSRLPASEPMPVVPLMASWIASPMTPSTVMMPLKVCWRRLACACSCAV